MKALAAAALLAIVACSAPKQADSESKSLPAASPPVAAAPARKAWSHLPPLEAKPAAVPFPQPPAAGRVARADAPPEGREQSGELTRNASVLGRLPQAGHRASFPFECEAREQSLFELAGFGYARGSVGRVRMSIEDSAGASVWESEREVGVVWRDFSAFTAPRAGTWTYTLTTLEAGYRFVLVRHSDYAPLGPDPIALGERAQVHGHLPDGESVAKFLVPVRAGEELAVKLTGTREEARAAARRGATEMSTMEARMPAEMPVRAGQPAARGGEPAGAPAPMAGGMAPQAARGGANAPQFQSFEFEAFQDGESLGRRAAYLRLRAPRDGTIEVRVHGRPGGGGGLFDLLVERDLVLLRVHGVVVDSEDRPLAGVELLFLREPDGDPLAFVESDEQGAFEAKVLAGKLTVQMRRGALLAREPVRVSLAEDTELDLLFEPAPRGRRR